MCGAICRRRYDYAAGSVAQSSAAQSGNVGERTFPTRIACASHAKYFDLQKSIFGDRNPYNLLFFEIPKQGLVRSVSKACACADQ